MTFLFKASCLIAAVAAATTTSKKISLEELKAKALILANKHHIDVKDIDFDAPTPDGRSLVENVQLCIDNLPENSKAFSDDMKVFYNCPEICALSGITGYTDGTFSQVVLCSRWTADCCTGSDTRMDCTFEIDCSKVTDEVWADECAQEWDGINKGLKSSVETSTTTKAATASSSLKKVASKDTIEAKEVPWWDNGYPAAKGWVFACPLGYGPTHPWLNDVCFGNYQPPEDMTWNTIPILG